MALASCRRRRRHHRRRRCRDDYKKGLLVLSIYFRVIVTERLQHLHSLITLYYSAKYDGLYL